MIIDFHTHVLPPRIKEDRSRYVNNDLAFAAIYSDPGAKIASAEDLIAGMDEDGVDISVIAGYGWSTHELCVETNDYILESVARYPKRLVGFCAVQPSFREAAEAEIARCARGGAMGVGELRPDMLTVHFTSQDVMKPFVDILREYRLILLLHTSEPVGHAYAGKGTATPDMIYPFIANFPDLPVVCAHWGGGLPFYALMPEVREALENVYFDTAASPFLYRPEIYEYVSRCVGTDRILFGSDYPLIPPSRLLREIDSISLPEKSRSMILSGNARRLLGI